jgi:hypothetical protein
LRPAAAIIFSRQTVGGAAQQSTTLPNLTRPVYHGGLLTGADNRFKLTFPPGNGKMQAQHID